MKRDESNETGPEALRRRCKIDDVTSGSGMVFRNVLIIPVPKMYNVQKVKNDPE